MRTGLSTRCSRRVLLLALLSAAFWALRPRQRRRARWFEEQARQQRRAAGGVPARPQAGAAAAHELHQPAISQHPSQWEQSARGALPVTAPATIGGLEVTTVLAPQSHYARLAEGRAPANGASSLSPTRAGSPSMEALIDLEQQIEFFVVLGQDEAAIALLDAHLRENGGASPLPFLQLLEIHQRRGDRAAYEQVRQRYRQHFDAFAPEWSADLHFGRALDEYPSTVARVQALWPTPLYSMQTLDALLFRRSENDDSFDFPAYRDLLFLYAIARDLAGHVDTEGGSIDLFLPLDDTATSERAEPEIGYAVDLDVSGWSDDVEAEAEPIVRPGARRAAG